MHLVIASDARARYPAGRKEFGNDAMDDSLRETPRLWTTAGFQEDEWHHLPADAPRPEAGKFILPLDAFLALGPAILDSDADRLGVLLRAGDAVDGIIDRIQSLPLIALDFPAFSDGRSYSKAGLLSARYAYQGAIRAVGDVLIDQIPLMLRAGFTEFEVTNETALRRLEEGNLPGLSNHYQPTARSAAKTESYSWRRRS